jgi:hypothetical protein
MNYRKENLLKLLNLVEEIAKDKNNDWFKDDLYKRLFFNSYKPISSPVIDEIYEHCIRKIIKEHAEQFYADFKLTKIKEKLIDDFVRMEKFRRDDNFEDFCLAAFQQIEAIVNELSTENIRLYFQKEYNTITHKSKNKANNSYEEKRLWQLILYPGMTKEELNKKIEKNLQDWDFLERFKLVSFYYNFNKKIYNHHDFNSNYFLLYDLYQTRNLNHRGGKTTEKQDTVIRKVKSNTHKYYFKFLGFLESFTTSININI